MIIKFLRDSYQYKLRKSAMLRSDRFEHTLDRYKYLFINGFNEKINNLKPEHASGNFLKLRDVLSGINGEEINYFFERLRSVYIKWINAQTQGAIKGLEELMDDFNLFQFVEVVENDVFFRGRESKEFISHWDMFHIPFNKRYLIKNQRYSLVGQPLLYLSTSTYGVIKELKDSKEVRISSFRTGNKVKFKVFENINKFSELLFEEKTSEEDFAGELADMILINNSIFDNPGKIRAMLFLLILSSCCSMETREELSNGSFCEEYVLPQILMLVLKKRGYEGVRYISTIAYRDCISKVKNDITNTIYSNIGLFTNYSEQDSKDMKNVYDRVLYNKFIISNPHKFDIALTKELYCIDDSLKRIEKMDIDNYLDEYNKNHIHKIANDLEKIRSIMEIGDELLNKALNLHSFMLKNIIMNISEKRGN